MGSKRSLLLILVGVIGITSRVHSQTIQDKRETAIYILTNKLMDGYQPETRPVYDVSTKTNVSIDLYLGQLIGMDEACQAVSIVETRVTKWRDEFLVWNSSEHAGIEKLKLSYAKLWTPALIPTNKMSGFQSPDVHRFSIDVNSNGDCTMFELGRLDFFCSLNMEHFPYDKHRCSIDYIVQDYGSLEMNLSFSLGFGRVFKNNSEFVVSDISTRVDILREHSTLFSNNLILAHLWMDIKRNPELFLMTAVAPMIMLNFLAVSAYLLPPASDGKLDVLVTIILSQAVYMTILTDDIPNGTITPKLVTTLIIMMGFTLTVTVLAMMIIRMVDMNSDRPSKFTLKVTNLLSNLLCLRLDRCFPKNKSNTAVEPNAEEKDSACDHRNQGFQYICDWITRYDQQQLVKNQWLEVAMVLDRVIFLLGVVIQIIVIWHMYNDEEAD